MGTNRPSNRDAPRVPGEEGGGAPWGKIIAALIGLILLAILIPLACQALRGGTGDEGSDGTQDSEEAAQQSRNGGGAQGDGDDDQGNGDGGGTDEADGSGGGNGAREGDEGREVTGEIAGIEGRGGDGTSVTIPQATISGADGWVAVRTDDGGEPGAVLGWAPIREGENSSAEVPLEETLASTQRLYAVLHADEPADGEFTFPDGDPPLDADERASTTEPFRYALTGAETGEQQEEAVSPNSELPESGGVSPPVLLAMGTALFLAGLALLRGAVARRKEDW